MGGNWNNGSNAGLANANGNNSLSNSNSNIGARLACGIATVYDNKIMLGCDLAPWQKRDASDSRSVGRNGKGSSNEDRTDVSRFPKAEVK